MKVTTGGNTCAADLGDDLPTGNLGADSNQSVRAMGIHGLVPIPMIDLNGPTISVAPAGKDNLARKSSPDRGPAASADVDATVEPGSTMMAKRMSAIAELRTDLSGDRTHP